MHPFMLAGKSSSALGFGCGSVLGRVGYRASLRAMHCAWDAGITLFETARSYGLGGAEGVLGEFLRHRRDQAVVITKYGIAPQSPGAFKRLALPLERVAARSLPAAVRTRLRKHSPPQIRAGEFSPEGLRRSVETSLRELRTDYLDLLLLQEPDASKLHQDDLLSELDLLIRQGHIRHAGIYANADVISAALTTGPGVLSAMEFGFDPFQPPLAPLAQPRAAILIGNHPFQSAERIARIVSVLTAIRADQNTANELGSKLDNIDWPLILECLLGVAFAGAGFRALIFSMMQTHHVRANIRAIEHNRFSADELAVIFHALQNTAALPGSPPSGEL